MPFALGQVLILYTHRLNPMKRPAALTRLSH